MNRTQCGSRCGSYNQQSFQVRKPSGMSGCGLSCNHKDRREHMEWVRSYRGKNPRRKLKLKF